MGGSSKPRILHAMPPHFANASCLDLEMQWNMSDSQSFQQLLERMWRRCVGTVHLNTQPFQVTTYNATISACEKGGRAEHAFGLLDSMMDRSLSPDAAWVQGLPSIIYVYIYICIACLCMHANKRLGLGSYVCTYVFIYTYVDAPTHTYTCVCICVCIHVLRYVPTYVDICTLQCTCLHLLFQEILQKTRETTMIFGYIYPIIL